MFLQLLLLKNQNNLYQLLHQINDEGGTNNAYHWPLAWRSRHGMQRLEKSV